MSAGMRRGVLHILWILHKSRQGVISFACVPKGHYVFLGIILESFKNLYDALDKRNNLLWICCAIFLLFNRNQIGAKQGCRQFQGEILCINDLLTHHFKITFAVAEIYRNLFLPRQP